MSVNIVKGRLYNITHSRKGTFQIRVTDVGNDFVAGDLIKGRTNALCEDNVREEGERVEMRTTLIRKAVEVEEPSDA